MEEDLPCFAGIPINLVVTLDGFAIEPQDFGEFNLVFGEGLGGGVLAGKGGFLEVSLGSREGFTFLNLFGEVAKVAFEENGSSVGTDADSLILCDFTLVLRFHLRSGGGGFNRAVKFGWSQGEGGGGQWDYWNRELAPHSFLNIVSALFVITDVKQWGSVLKRRLE